MTADDVAEGIDDGGTGWGNLVEVLEPQSVRDLLGRLGSELATAHS
ncbi:MAG TPA: hypothetical protein VFY98_01165 [Intrasporangium sp.]|nr:hypothetical protein [Intrasporangium sp.]